MPAAGGASGSTENRLTVAMYPPAWHNASSSSVAGSGASPGSAPDACRRSIPGPNRSGVRGCSGPKSYVQDRGPKTSSGPSATRDRWRLDGRYRPSAAGRRHRRRRRSRRFRQRPDAEVRPVAEDRLVDSIDQTQLEAFVGPQKPVATGPDVASPPGAVTLAGAGREQLRHDLLVMRREPLVVLEDALVLARDHPLARVEHERPEAADRSCVAGLQHDGPHRVRVAAHDGVDAHAEPPSGEVDGLDQGQPG